jgi:uncharacterized OB-fold protein
MKPLPVPDRDTQPFWDACRRHELRAQRCAACGRFRWPPQGLCPHCHRWEHAWTRLPETGTVLSFVVVHYVAVPAFAGDVPYVIAHVTMDGTHGEVTLTSNVVGCPWEEVSVGMPVSVVFEDVTAACTLPRFRAARPPVR